MNLIPKPPGAILQAWISNQSGYLLHLRIGAQEHEIPLERLTQASELGEAIIEAEQAVYRDAWQTDNDAERERRAWEPHESLRMGLARFEDTRERYPG